MSTPPDPLISALHDAFEDERRSLEDDALIVRAIARATDTLSATRRSTAASKLSYRPRPRLVRVGVPLAATFAASVALASAYLATRSNAVPPAPPSETPIAPPAKAPEPPHGATAMSSPGEIPSISVDDLPSTKPSAAGTSAHIWSPYPPDDVTAAELFRNANAERRSGDVEKATELYASLQRRFPDSSETQASHVSLGRLLLDRRNDAHGALAQFDAYLNSHATDNTLSEEARLGRALAWQRLGKAPEERAAWQELLREHPRSLYASRAEGRLHALEAPSETH